MILEQIQYCMNGSMKCNFKPVLLLINLRTYANLLDELRKESLIPSFQPSSIFGLKVLIVDDIEDFQVIDNRSWVYQKYN